MEETDKKRFAELMAGLAQTFVVDVSARDIENYWRFLRSYPLKQVEQAILDYCVSPEGHAFMPKPGEIVASLRGKDNERSLLAWVKVMQAMKKSGAYKTVIFDDAIIHAAIEGLGGWIRLCLLPEKELIFQQKEFERLYQCYLHQAVLHYPRQLIGIFDRDNAAAGYTIKQKPLLFGDITQAALVFKSGAELDSLNYQTLHIDQILKLSTKALDKKSKSVSVKLADTVDINFQEIKHGH